VVPSAKVSPQLTTRVVDKCREILNDYLPDVWLSADHCKGIQAGNSAGYSVSLSAETSTGCIITKDFTFSHEEFKLPEDLGEAAALALLDEVYYGGCVDSAIQPIALLLMALSSNEDVSSIKIGRLTS